MRQSENYSFVLTKRWKTRDNLIYKLNEVYRNMKNFNYYNVPTERKNK